MRLLGSMTEAETHEYVKLLGKATGSLVPPDGTFCLVINGPEGKSNYVSSANRLNIPAMLRELADMLEAEMSQHN